MRDEWITKFIKEQNENFERSTTHTENGVKVFYPSSKAVKDGIEKSMA